MVPEGITLEPSMVKWYLREPKGYPTDQGVPEGVSEMVLAEIKIVPKGIKK